jgi:Arc/MetJ family transcription regulator
MADTDRIVRDGGAAIASAVEASMSTRVDHIQVPDALMEQAMLRARTQEPEAAILEALREYTRPRSQADLIKYLGTSDGFYTSDELDRMRDIDS